MVNAFNQYFTSIGPKLASEFLHTNNPNEIQKNSVPVLDSIKATVIKYVATVIPQPIATLINHSLSARCFSSALKEAVVSPIHKSKCDSEIGNYQPNSVLTVISKVFERVSMYACTMNYLNEYSFHIENQYVFKPEHSTDLALVMLQ